jgi:lipoprotein-anchoring transpeptidase ErfK/SrfK
VLAACAAGALMAGAVSYPVLSGRTRLPYEARERARDSLDKARRDGALRWAPGELQSAEETWRAGLAEERRQQARVIFLRDFRRVYEGYSKTEELANAASTAAIERGAQARAGSLSEIERVGQVVGRAGGVAQYVPLSAYWRGRLQGSKLSLSEARALFSSGQWEAAAACAQSAERDAAAVLDHVKPLVARFVDREQLETWRRRAEETISWSSSTGRPAIVVYKEKRLLALYTRGRQVRAYKVELGPNSIRPKRRAGDKATPEGCYLIEAKIDQGMSKFHKALRINYPNQTDRLQFEEAQRAGALDKAAKLGGLIEIHGEGGRGSDWTDGCIALTNDDMDDLFPMVEVGTPVAIVGGDGSGGIYSDLMRRLYGSSSSD